MAQLDDNRPNDPLTPQEEAQVRLLTVDDIRYIDDRLMSQVSHRWYKVARVVGRIMMDLQKEFPIFQTPSTLSVSSIWRKLV